MKVLQGKFKLVSEYKPAGDQPQAVDKLVSGIQRGYRFQTPWRNRYQQSLYHSKCNRKGAKTHAGYCPQQNPAAQLCTEFKVFRQTVEYFVSCMTTISRRLTPQSDTYIESSSINDE